MLSSAGLEHSFKFGRGLVDKYIRKSLNAT
jgi:hypothetical protein